MDLNKFEKGGKMGATAAALILLFSIQQDGADRTAYLVDMINKVDDRVIVIETVLNTMKEIEQNTGGR